MEAHRKPTDGLDGRGGVSCVNAEIPTADGVGRYRAIPTAITVKPGRSMVDAPTRNDAKNKEGSTISQMLKNSDGK